MKSKKTKKRKKKQDLLDELLFGDPTDPRVYMLWQLIVLFVRLDIETRVAKKA